MLHGLESRRMAPEVPRRAEDIVVRVIESSEGPLAFTERVALAPEVSVMVRLTRGILRMSSGYIPRHGMVLSASPNIFSDIPAYNARVSSDEELGSTTHSVASCCANPRVAHADGLQ